MGSSAGGHLASTLLTHFDSGDTNSADPVERQSSRPDIGILCYPVITMGEYTHQGSKENLLGKNPSPETGETAFQRIAGDDQHAAVFPLDARSRTRPCRWRTALMFAEALRKNHVPFDLHIYQKGGHGMGLKDKPPFAHPHPWAGDCLFWLKAQNFVK